MKWKKSGKDEEDWLSSSEVGQDPSRNKMIYSLFLTYCSPVLKYMFTI